jgi:hypothetical protein
MLIKSLAQCHAELLQPRNRFKSGGIGSMYHGLSTYGYLYHRLGRHESRSRLVLSTGIPGRGDTSRASREVRSLAPPTGSELGSKKQLPLRTAMYLIQITRQRKRWKWSI